MRLNGVELTSVHRALSIEKEIPPGTAPRAQETIQTATGEIITEERLEAGEYIVRANIFAGTNKEAWNVRELLANWASLRGLGTAELIPTHRPSRCYDARLKSISDPEFVHGGAKVEIRFLIPRPAARSTTQSEASGVGGVTMNIGGTYECRPALSQTLSADQDGLVWVMDGIPFLTITGALSAGQTVRMDIKNESLTIDGEHAESRVNMSGTKWRPGYWPGVHTIESSDTAGSFSARWYDEWL